MIAGLAYNKKLEKYSFKLYSQHQWVTLIQDVIHVTGSNNDNANNNNNNSDNNNNNNNNNSNVNDDDNNSNTN